MMVMNLKPLKKYSQNFLKNKCIQKKIVDALDSKENDIIIEIGAGFGNLTQLLVKKPYKELILLEIDPRCIKILNERFGKDAMIINRSILEFNFKELNIGGKVKVIGNIPYHLTSPIIFTLLKFKTHLDQAVLMVQKEVADRILAKPSCKEYGVLSIMVAYKADVQRLFNVGRNNFYPVPQVDSAVINLNMKPEVTDIIDYNLFNQVVRITFQTRRKMLRNSLSRFLGKNIIDKIKTISLLKRPEQLSLQDFINLSNEIYRIINNKLMLTI